MMKTDTVTTKVHRGSYSATEIQSAIQAAAISRGRKEVGLVDDAKVVSSQATIEADGSVTVEIVETVPSVADAGTTGVAERPAPTAVGFAKPAEVGA